MAPKGTQRVELRPQPWPGVPDGAHVLLGQMPWVLGKRQSAPVYADSLYSCLAPLSSGFCHFLFSSNFSKEFRDRSVKLRDLAKGRGEAKKPRPPEHFRLCGPLIHQDGRMII